MKPNKTLPLLFFTFGILCQVIGYLLYGTPSSPDELTGISQIIGAFLIFCFWILSLTAWGSVICGIIQIPSRFLESILFGSGFGAILAGLLGYSGLIGPPHENLALLILVSGLGINFFIFRNNETFSIDYFKENFLAREKFSSWVMAAIAITFVLNLIDTFRISSFWDPLWYHLTGPRMWSDRGQIYFDPKAMALMQASSWEYLFLWGNTLLTGPKGTGLIVGQLFGQWTHLVFGFGGAAIASYSFLLNFSSNRKWILLAVLAMMVSFPLSYVTPLAKNDWGIAFWTLGAFAILFDRKKSGSAQLLASGVLLGLALSGKITAVFTIAPLFLLWPYFRKKTSSRKLTQSFLIILLGLGVGGSLIWARNFVFTGNPFFPSMNGIFHSPYLGPTWERAIVLYEGHFMHFEGWTMFSKEMTGNYLSWAFFLIPFGAFWFFKDRSLLFLAGAVFLSLFLFLAKVGIHSETRILGSAALLMVALSVLALHDIWFCFFPKKGDIGFLILFLVILALGDIPWNSPLNLEKEPNPSIQIRAHIGGGSLAWLRDNIKENESAVSLADTRLYYVSHLNVNRIWDNVDLDRAILATPDSALDLTKTLRKFGYTYLIDNTQPLDFVYNNSICHRLIDAIEKVRDNVTPYSSHTDYVVDLAKLEKILSE